MNRLEELTADNQNNYNLYLERMYKSLFHSTKGLIPLYAQKYHNILDVGCADGSLTKIIQNIALDAEVLGIDINGEAVQKAKENGVNALQLSLAEMPKLGKKFDCIIFSSVLHEFSSYDIESPFNYPAITKALIDAKKILTDDGVIIIRDGLRVCFNEPVSWVEMKFAIPADKEWFYHFISEFKGFGDIPLNESFFVRDDGKIYCRYDVAQEFLATWTWGPKSWHREINEKFCILTEGFWKHMFDLYGFNIEHFERSKEEYPTYLKDKVTLFDECGNEIFPDMTFFAIIKKKN